MSRLYPIGIQYFEKIGEGKYAYVERLHGFINRCKGETTIFGVTYAGLKKPTCSCFSTLLHAEKTVSNS